MLDFFIAVFGSLWYSSTALGGGINRLASSIRDGAFSIWDERLKEEVVASNEIENTIEKRVSSGGYTWQIYEELSDDLTFIFGDDYRRKCRFVFRDNTPITRSEYSYEYMAYQLLLSHIGKISQSVALCGGFRLGGGDATDRNIKMCQRIEYNLRKHHDWIRLYLNPCNFTGDNRYDPRFKTMVFEHQIRRFGQRDDESRLRLWQ